MRRVLFVGACAAALVAAPPASTERAVDIVAGAGWVTQVVPGLVERDHFSVGARSEPDGTNPRGHVFIRGPFGGEVQTFHGDVREGCVRVNGNRGLAVGRLPEREQFDVPGFGRIEYAAVFVEDNGNPSDAIVDRAFAVLFRASTAALNCDPLRPLTFTSFPLEQGNVTVHDATP